MGDKPDEESDFRIPRPAFSDETLIIDVATAGTAWTTPARFDRRAVARSTIAMAAVVVTASRDSIICTSTRTQPNGVVTRPMAPLRENRRLSLNRLGSSQFVLPMSSVVYATGRIAHNPSLRDADPGCAAAHRASAGLRKIIHHSISRARPHGTPSAVCITVPGTTTRRGRITRSSVVTSPVRWPAGHFSRIRYSVGIAAPMVYLTTRPSS